MLQAPNSIMEQLKASTAELHRTAETRDLQKGMIKGSLPRELFVEYLGQMYLIHRALENALLHWKMIHVRGIPQVFRDYYRREPNLRADLDFFGWDAFSVEPTPTTSEFINKIEDIAAVDSIALLGLLYVLEGSMNGNIFVARSVGVAYDLKPGLGLSYLNPYGDQATQKARWQQFKDDMNAANFTEEETASILAAANLMFSSIIALSDELMQPAFA